MDIDGYAAVETAFYHAVHDFPGGAEALAGALGMRGRVLSNKANPGQDHQPTVKEFAAVILRTGDLEPFYSLSALFHHTSIPLPNFEAVSDVELLNSYSAWQAFLGRTSQSIHDALADGEITADEVEEIKRRGFAHIQRFFQMISRLESLQVNDV